MNGKIIIFSRAPVSGEAKTRLIPALGAQGAAALQAMLLHLTLETALETCAPCELWCAPSAGHPALEPFRQQYAVEFRTQQGADLGERMTYAFAQTLQSADAALLIGADCPNIYPTYLRAAMTTLAGGSDVVLGPANDGGYILIGLKKPAPELFAGIPWGGERVLDMTREKLRQLKLKWRELPPMNDLDTPADLALFPHLAPPVHETDIRL